MAAIAGVGTISGAIEDGLKVDARKLLGGDVDLRLTHHEFSENQQAWLSANTDRMSPSGANASHGYSALMVRIAVLWN